MHIKLLETLFQIQFKIQNDDTIKESTVQSLVIV